MSPIDLAGPEPGSGRALEAQCDMPSDPKPAADYRAQSAKWFKGMLAVVAVVMLMLVFAKIAKSDLVAFELTYEGKEGMTSVGWWLIGLAMLLALVAAFKGLKAWRHDQGLGKIFWLSLLSVPSPSTSCPTTNAAANTAAKR